MDNGIYITLSRQLALFRDMEATANNIANTNTTGYSSERINFNSYLVRDVNRGQPNKMAFAYDVSSSRNLTGGAMKTTDSPLDVAINGRGYFTVQTPLGIRYTRAGNFQLSADGTLLNGQGYPVMDTNNQPITFPEDAETVEIGTIGNIKINDEEFGQLNVVQFDNEQLLEPAGDNLFITDATAKPIDETQVKILHGVLEGSNVNPITEMTHMLDVSRAVANTAKFVEVMYDLERKATNIWAKQG